MSERLIRPDLAPRELPPLIEALILAELLASGQGLTWSVPVIGDAPMIDNCLNAYAALDPTWPQGFVRLTHVLRHLAMQGRPLLIETLDTEANHRFAELLAFSHPNPDAVRFAFVDALTAPGWAGETWALIGRARWTESGILPEESLRLTQETARIAEVRALLAERKEAFGC